MQLICFFFCFQDVNDFFNLLVDTESFPPPQSIDFFDSQRSTISQATMTGVDEFTTVDSTARAGVDVPNAPNVPAGDSTAVDVGGASVG